MMKSDPSENLNVVMSQTQMSARRVDDCCECFWEKSAERLTSSCPITESCSCLTHVGVRLGLQFCRGQVNALGELLPSPRWIPWRPEGACQDFVNPPKKHRYQAASFMSFAGGVTKNHIVLQIDLCCAAPEFS